MYWLLIAIVTVVSLMSRPYCTRVMPFNFVFLASCFHILLDLKITSESLLSMRILWLRIDFAPTFQRRDRNSTLNRCAATENRTIYLSSSKFRSTIAQIFWFTCIICNSITTVATILMMVCCMCYSAMYRLTANEIHATLMRPKIKLGSSK